LIDVLSRIISVPDVPTVPCIWQTLDESKTRNDAAVPDAEAATDHVPLKAIAPAEAAANGEAGSEIVASTPDGLLAAQFAASAPL
jgi:hypothetical protein